jgi:CMP/dCMP kinase
MIIAISGFSGSGKNTVGEKVAKELKLRLIEYTFKDYAKEMGVELMDVQKMANKDQKIDKEFDKRVAEDASKGNCVITTWLGPWIVKNANLRVWLEASQKARAKRIAGREKIPAKKALEHLKNRDADNLARYKKLYGIDISDKGIFDCIINTENFLPDEIAKTIIAAAKCKRGASSWKS